MSDRGEQRKGPIVRYGRRGKDQKGPIRHADPGPSAPEPSPPGPSSSGLSAPGPAIRPSAPPIQVRTRRRSSYSGSGLRLLIISAFALVVIAAVVLPIANFGSTTFHIPSFHVPTVTPTVNPPTTSAPTRTTTVTTHNPAAYLTASGLAAGLAHIRGLAPGARVSLVRVASDSLIATAGLPNGRFKEIVLQPSGQFVISEPNPGERLVPFAEVRPSAVARIVAAMRSRYHVPASRIDYIVLSSPTGAPTQWIAFTKAPGHPGYSATLSGTHLTRLP